MKKQQFEKLLTAYAGALNSANIAIIPSFYAEDGLIMPDGFKELRIHNLVERSKGFFDKVRFQIDYALPETVIDWVRICENNHKNDHYQS